MNVVSYLFFLDNHDQICCRWHSRELLTLLLLLVLLFLLSLTHYYQMRRGWHARGLLPLLPQLHRCPWPCLQKWWVFSSNFWWYLHIASWQSSHVDDKLLTTISWHDTSVDQVCNIADERDVYIAERLFSSSLVAVVSGASPRTLRIEHFKKVSLWNFHIVLIFWLLDSMMNITRGPRYAVTPMETESEQSGWTEL